MMLGENSFYSEDELKNLGLKSIGRGVLLSRYARIYSAELIEIGDNVRIDDFCILSGKITFGKYIHVSAYTGFFAGSEGIEIQDYATISSGCMLYGLSDDYSGDYLTNSMIPNEFRNVRKAKLTVGKFSIVGTGCRIFPGVTIGEGTAVGAMSMVKKNLKAWTIYAGIPCREIRPRSREMLKYEEPLLEKYYEG